MPHCTQLLATAVYALDSKYARSWACIVTPGGLLDQGHYRACNQNVPQDADQINWLT